MSYADLVVGLEKGLDEERTDLAAAQSVVVDETVPVASSRAAEAELGEVPGSRRSGRGPAISTKIAASRSSSRSDHSMRILVG